MLDFLEIENFRCFEQFKIEGLAQVNLFGGLNNSGKTALLESFALATNPHLFLHDYAFVNIRNLKESKEDSVDNLFYNRQSTKAITFRSNYPVNITIKSPTFPTYAIPLSQLAIHKDFIHTNSYLTTKSLLFCYITAKGRSVPIELNLPFSFDVAETNERKSQLLEMLQCIDPQIIDARTFATKSQSIYLRRSIEERWFPMENLGDAAQKVLNYALNIYNLADDAATEKVLIIDEIENGLHYTVQESFWEQLFNLAKQFNIQIFAATHSLEMIKAYLNTIKKLGENAVSNKYWELFRNQKRNKIMAADRSAEQLEYVLSTPLNFRGE